MPVPIIVSVHLPKTAGTSFAATLQAQFGTRYRADYADLPMQDPPWRRRCAALRGGRALRRAWRGEVECIHGHFLPVKYAIALRDAPVRYVTWLRDPVERVVSHYHFWRRDYDGCDPSQPLRNRMLAEDWSLERFALGPELRDVYSQYLWRFDPGRFAFIGVTERYAEDLERFTRRFGFAPAVRGHALRNPDRKEAAYPLAVTLRRRIERHHGRDMALYASIVERGHAWPGSL